MKISSKNILLSSISGILLGYCLVTLNSYIIWFAFVPLLLAVYDRKIYESILYLSIFTLIFGVILYAWIPQSFQKYIGEFSSVSYLVLFVLILGNLFLFVLWLVAFKYLHISNNQSSVKKAIFNTILISSLYFLFEWINTNIFQGIPWNKINLRNAISSNIYFIQSASVIGSVGLSLIVISFNYLLTEFIKTKNSIILLIGIGIFASNLLFGFAIVSQSEESSNKKSVALVCENVKAETKWTEQGDVIISKMLSMVNEAKKYNPTLIVWPESALPWTYIENDDILLAISDILNGENTQNIIGYLTQSESDSNLVYNSAYLIDKNGKAIDRYDKRILLDFIEKPFLSNNYSKLLNMSVPSGYNNILTGKQNNLLNTKIGKCKVDICNESLIPDYFNLNDNSFEFIVNISNDAWFEGNQNIEHHFYLARLKAIEYRKYMIINSNRGISGIINHNGEIQISSKSHLPQKLIGYVIPNTGTTFYSQFPLFVPILSFLTLVIFTIKKIVFSRR